MLVTLTTDLGEADHYLGALKGTMLKHTPSLTFVDITNAIKPHDTKSAAYTIRNSYSSFVEGTLHVIHVGSTESKDRLLVCKHKGHTFLTFDNGILPLIIEGEPSAIFLLNDFFLKNTDPLFRESIAYVAKQIAEEKPLAEFASLIHNYVVKRGLLAIASPGSIRGNVVHIDHFGNVIYNITRALFEQYMSDRKYSIIINSYEVNTLQTGYQDVDEGDVATFFNSAGNLEVAIHGGRACDLLGLHLDSVLLVISR